MKKREDNTSYIKLFILVVLFTAFVSISYKAFLLIKTRSFRSSTFNIMVVGHDAKVLGFNTQKREIHTLEYIDARSLFSGKKTLSATLASGVPLDGMIISIKPDDLTNQDSNFPTFSQTISFILEDEKYVFHNINTFDLIKLFIIYHLTSWEEKNFETVKNLTDDFSENQELAELIGEKFYDSEILNEKTSIEVINSTNINGLGSRVGFVLSNLGANVISIKDSENSKTQLFARNKNLKTIKRIERLFELKAQGEDNTKIADLTINLGADLFKK